MRNVRALCFWLAACSTVAFLASCGGGGGGGGGSSAPTPPPVLTGLVIGTVIDGPIAGASIQVFDFTGGVQGALLGNGATDASGNYTATLTPRPTGPVKVVASGGSYMDEASGAGVTLGPSDQFVEIVSATDIVNGNLSAHLNPLNHIAASLAAVTANSLGMDNAILQAKETLGQQYGVSLLGLGSNLPISASNPPTTGAPTLAQKQAALLIAGFSQLANSLGVRTVDLVKAIADDFSDGKLDGKKNGLSITVPKIGGGSVPLAATTALSELQTAINVFSASTRNKTGVPALVLTSTTPIDAGLASNTASRLLVKSDVLPTFVTGLTNSVQLQVSGGTPPYAWGGLNSGCPASLSSSGLLTATGQALSGGTTLAVSGLCTLVVNDANRQQATFMFRITTVGGGPTVIPQNATMDANKQASVQIATATGGVTPYAFVRDSLANGATPPGTTVTSSNTAGFLSGTPTQAGTYTFGICAADTVGSQSCKPVTVTVRPSTANLTLAFSGTATGTVQQSAQGTSCGTNCFTFPLGSAVTLTAAPASGAAFAGWNGGGCSGTGTCSVTLNADTTVTATFNTAVPTFNLTATSTGSGTGSVTPNPTGAACGTGCSNYASGTVVTVTATADAGSTFSGWSGACSGTGGCSVTMSSNRSVTATFAATPLAGTWSGTWSWTGIASNGCTANDGGSFTVTLTQTGTSFSGTTSGAGIQTLNATTGCSVFATDPGTGTMSGTISGTATTYSFNLDVLNFQGTGPVNGSTWTGSFIRTTSGGSGSFNLTRATGTAPPFTNGATSGSGTSHWVRSLTQSTEQFAFYSDGTGAFIAGGTCASGAITWTQTSSTSISINLPPTISSGGGSSTTPNPTPGNECPRTYAFTNLSVGGGKLSATLNNFVNPAQSVTYILVGGHIQ